VTDTGHPPTEPDGTIDGPWPDRAPADIGILRRREIEALVLARVYAVMARELGVDQARSILMEAVEQDAVAAGARLAEGVPPDQRLRAFIAVQDQWTADDALDQEVVVATDTAFSYIVHRCAYAELYRRLGLAELGPILSCSRDAAFIRGVDPRIQLDRPSTIMEGADRCVFHYRLPRANLGRPPGPGPGSGPQEILPTAPHQRGAEDTAENQTTPLPPT
jgi:hypothetical protein